MEAITVLATKHHARGYNKYFLKRRTTTFLLYPFTIMAKLNDHYFKNGIIHG